MSGGRGRARIEGLDLARLVALVGMVAVNFRVVMSDGSESSTALDALFPLLEGRAAATFVVLAGIGLGLSAATSDHERPSRTILKRAGFLLVAGLLNAIVFDGDILHFYAFYFAIGSLCLPLGTRAIATLCAVLPLAFFGAAAVFDYEAGWNWSALEYEDFWSPAGFFRHVFFNGWHPVLPWISYFLGGIALSRLDLRSPRVARLLTAVGLAFYLVAEGASSLALATIDLGDPELNEAVFGTGPIPPMPLYMLAGFGAAGTATGLSLLLAPALRRIGAATFLLPAGRQTLTLYIAHIYIGMGTLEALDMLGNRHTLSILIATAVFSSSAVVFAWLWSLRFRRGPLEELMRRLTG